MPSTAQTAQKSKLRIETASATALTITGITKADPAVVSFTGTDPVAGSIVAIAGVIGMIEVNGRSFVVGTVVPSTSFVLLKVDSSAYGAYVSDGTATPKTMTPVGNVKDFDIQQDPANDIQTTNLDSIRQEFLPGLPGSWTMTNAYDIDSDDTGQDEFEAAQDDQVARAFSLTLASGAVFTGLGYVKSYSAAGSPEATVSGSVQIRGTNKPSWFV